MADRASGPESIRFPSPPGGQPNSVQFPTNTNLQAVGSDESVLSSASTIYDPAVLAMSPEYRAVVQQRQNRDPFQQDEPERNGAVLHVATPAARKPVPMPVGETLIRPPEEAEMEDEEEKLERELCCHGLLPLFPSMVLFNVVNVIIGIVCIGIGVAQLRKGHKDVVGFGSAGRLVVTGSYLLTIFSISLGCLFVFCGVLGAAVNYSKAYKSPNSSKLSDLVYHCLLFLVTIICIIIFGLNIYSITVRQSGPVYDTELWKEFVRSNSRHLCNLETKLNCAAMSLGQCVSTNNETRHTFCPGHFCVDFCRIATDDVSLHPICSSCRKDPLSSIPVFVECKALEKKRSEVLTCDSLPDEELDSAYGQLLVIAVVSFVWILVVWAVIAYVECLL